MPQAAAEMMSDLIYLLRRALRYFHAYRVDRRLSPSSQSDRDSAMAALEMAVVLAQESPLPPRWVVQDDLVFLTALAWRYWHQHKRNGRLSPSNQADRIAAIVGLDMAAKLAVRMRDRFRLEEEEEELAVQEDPQGALGRVALEVVVVRPGPDAYEDPWAPEPASPPSPCYRPTSP
jgi:hypothetical protein